MKISKLYGIIEDHDKEKLYLKCLLNNELQMKTKAE